MCVAVVMAFVPIMALASSIVAIGGQGNLHNVTMTPITIQIGNQQGTLTAGQTGTITFPIHAPGLSDYTRRAVMFSSSRPDFYEGSPYGLRLEPYSMITIENGQGTMTLQGLDSTAAGSFILELNVDIDRAADGSEIWVRTNPFTVNISEQQSPLPTPEWGPHTGLFAHTILYWADVPESTSASVAIYLRGERVHYSTNTWRNGDQRQANIYEALGTLQRAGIRTEEPFEIVVYSHAQGRYSSRVVVPMIWIPPATNFRLDGNMLRWNPVETAVRYAVWLEASMINNDYDDRVVTTSTHVDLNDFASVIERYNLREGATVTAVMYVYSSAGHHAGRLNKLEFQLPNLTGETPTDTPTIPDEDNDEQETASGNDNGENIPDRTPPEFIVTPSPIDTGVWMEFTTIPNNRYGYRVFRATSATGEGLSISDFPITVNPAHSRDLIITFDPNVRPNTQYWYYIREVIQEAHFDIATTTLTPEVLGSPSARVSVTTSADIPSPTAERGFIMMFVGNPHMNVNNVWEGIDPPSNVTAPVINAGRTMIPIRAIIEAMGGTAQWDSSDRRADLRSHGNHVQMWLGQRDVQVNGAPNEMDVVPEVVNDRTLIPLRFVAEFLGSHVEWIGSQRMIVVVFELQE